MSKQMLKVMCETLENTCGMKLMMKFYCVCTISLNFEFFFPQSTMEIVSRVMSGKYFYLKLLKNARFPRGFFRNVY